MNKIALMALLGLVTYNQACECFANEGQWEGECENGSRNKVSLCQTSDNKCHWGPGEDEKCAKEAFLNIDTSDQSGGATFNDKQVAIPKVISSKEYCHSSYAEP